ncbi:MAG TPA: RDD family protein [Actinomycetes bacterium]|nr:RDD family protein [Actinomycetes bacterium]
MTNSQLESARMVTPEAVALEFRTANLGSRILAYLIDMVVVVVGILAGLFAVALLGQASDVVVPDWVALTIVLVLLPAWWLGYFIAFETLWRGRTLGKAALGLRVVTKEGAPIRFRHAAIRGLLGLVDFLILGGFLAVVFILFTRDNQRLGDLVAGTLVLRERSALAAPAPVSFTPPPGLEHYTATLDPSGVGNEEYQAVRTFLLRAPSLSPGPRSALALQLANPLAARLRPPPPPGISPELYLQCVAAAYQQRQRLAAPPTATAGSSVGAVDSAARPPSGPASVPLREAGPGAGSLNAGRGAGPGTGALNAGRGAEPGAGSVEAAPEPGAPEPAAPERRERAGEGGGPSPVVSDGFAPPG